MHRPHATPLVLKFAAGTLTTFYGRHFAYTLLFAQVFEQHGRPFLRRALQDMRELMRRARDQSAHINEATAASRDAVRRLNALQEAFTRASAEGGNDHEADLLQREMMQMQDELQQDMLRVGAASSSILSSLEPHRLAMMARGLYLGFVGLAAAATSHGARRLGIGCDIGERLARAIYALCEPVVHRHVLPLLCRLSRDFDRVHAHPDFGRYLDLVLVALCSSVGVGVAYQVERLVFVAANTIWGAELMVAAASEALGPLLPDGWRRPLAAPHHTRRVHTLRLSATLLLATGGAYSQLVLGRGAEMPLAMRAVLFAPLLAERWLMGATQLVRGPLASVAQAAGGDD